jgi:hypothetical protein
MKFLNLWDVGLILGVTVATHILLKPLYRRIDGNGG